MLFRSHGLFIGKVTEEWMAIAIVLTFKAELILEKVFKKEPTQGLVLRVKYIALALAVIAFMAVFILGR